MNKELTHDQFTELKKEFVDFKINEMSREQMADWISTVYLSELDKCTEDEVKEEIDYYDDNLYEVLLPYVLDEEGSWEIMEEFKSDRAMLDFLNRGDDF
tara:strand:- start:167 stop:463 length:297 start_codon:yes stop_codon:yes gene_type:complete